MRRYTMINVQLWNKCLVHSKIEDLPYAISVSRPTEIVHCLQRIISSQSLHTKTFIWAQGFKIKSLCLIFKL
jgi:hypothetical protein